MKMLMPVFALAAVAALAGTGDAGDALAAEAQMLRAKAAQVRLDPGRLRWKEIPWYTDLAEAMQVAREEQRPLLIWVSGDDPLGRC